jgi:hypothetical protein
MLNVIMLNVIMMNVVMLNVVMQNVIMLNVIMLNVIMLNVVMLNVVFLSVMGPKSATPGGRKSCLGRVFNFRQVRLPTKFFTGLGQIIKLFTVVIYESTLYRGVFLLGKLLQPYLMFVDMTRSPP